MTATDPKPTPRRSPHPAIAGREEPMRRLADTVRDLIDLVVSCDVPSEVADAVDAELKRASATLEEHRNDPPHPRFVLRSDYEGAQMVDAMPYDFVVGPYNPLALPVEIELDPPKAIGRAHFTTPYEGAPGWVHGAAIAGTFDLVLTAANRLESTAGPTVNLSLKFLKPTLIGVEARFEAWIEELKGNRITSKGHLIQNDRVTVEAEGEFAVIDPSRMGIRRDNPSG